MAAGASADHAQLLYQLADIDKQTAGTIAFVLQPVLSISTLLMIVRIVLSWYPQVRCAGDFTCPLSQALREHAS